MSDERAEAAAFLRSDFGALEDLLALAAYDLEGVQEALAARSEALRAALDEAVRKAKEDRRQDAMCHNGHPFVRGVDLDDPDRPSDRWCNVCGEARRAR